MSTTTGINEESFLTSGEVVRNFGIAYATLQKRRERGDLAAYRDPMNDRAVLYRKSDIEKMLRPVPLRPMAKSASR